MLLVHVVGNADLGLRSKEDGSERLSLLRAVGGPEAARLLGLTDGGDWFADGALSPLRKELVAAARIQKPEGEPLKVLVIGAAGGRGSTEETARVIRQALARACESDGLALLNGRNLRVLDALVLDNGLNPGVGDHEKLETAIGRHHGHVVLSLAGGASTVLVEAAGVAAATHPAEWSLLLIDRAGDDPRAGIAPRIDMSVTSQEDPLRGWLMGLGLPTVLNAEYERRREVLPDEFQNAASAVRRAAGEEAVSAAPEDLAVLLWADVARGDLAAGMALRAWLVAEYRRRRCEYLGETGEAPDQYPDATLNGKGEPIMIGKAIGNLHRSSPQETLAEPDAWLVGQKHLVDIGNAATHELKTATEELRECLPVLLGDRPDWLSWPSGDVCLLSGQGKLPAADIRRPPIAATMMSQEPAAALRRACAVDAPLTLDALLLCSEETVEDGRRVADEITADSFSRNQEWDSAGADGLTVCSYGRPTTDNGIVSADAEEGMRRVQSLADGWLKNRPRRPRAIVTTVVGEKPVVIALLRAAQVFGARHGIPVFLMSSVKNGPGAEELQFHQFGLDRDVREALLTAAEHCLDRLDLLTAARLLALGDPAMAGLADDAIALSDDLLTAVRSQDLDGCASTVLSVMRSVGTRIDHVEPDAQVRLATIVGELLRLPPRSRRSEAFREPQILAHRKPSESGAPADLDSEDAMVLLRLLVQVRDEVPLNHGDRDLQGATAHVLQHYAQQESCTYAQLIDRAVRTVTETHGVTVSDWADRLDGLRRKVSEQQGSAYGTTR
ncbi:hypothetical protein [Actinomyces trachealis]|uniref:hypothetical protein n=1 Tax=Actinomyces trachealis TaxID=2763540 RepID=UPI0018C69FB3|nr:hypothetical protein [Actinomyces trachealis]